MKQKHIILSSMIRLLIPLQLDMYPAYLLTVLSQNAKSIKHRCMRSPWH